VLPANGSVGTVANNGWNSAICDVVLDLAIDPRWPSPSYPVRFDLSLESAMGDQKRNSGLTDEEQKREDERTDYQKDRASNPERQEEHDPSRIKHDAPKRETTR
jgi:hypothetical protein